jgi:hypothetical protein
MKADQVWSFSCPASRVDVSRILREAQVRAGRVVRFTVADQVYTAWSDHHYPPASGQDELFFSPGYSVVFGDRAGELLGRVTVTVEVFEPGA